jgi:hypothetical protein
MLRRVLEYRSHRLQKKCCLRLLWMNTAQITHALEQDPVTSKKFCGVLPSDKLPQTIDRYPCGFVANTDPSSEPGTHWVAFHFPWEEKGEFLDSYGHARQYYRKSFGDFLKSRAWDFNRHKLQSAWSDVCGQYCLFYLSHRAGGSSPLFFGDPNPSFIGVPRP